jgi:hypothetical protein
VSLVQDYVIPQDATPRGWIGAQQVLLILMLIDVCWFGEVR